MADKPPRLSIISATAGRLAGISPLQDKALLKDLSRGKYEPTEVLDLHGHISSSGRLAFEAWIKECYHQGHRCVMVITGKGKGYGNSGDMGLHKANLPSWLEDNPNVLAFHSAPPAWGGSGACLIYLRRNRVF